MYSGGPGCAERARRESAGNRPTGQESLGATPWFPEFYSAVQLARGQTRATGLADPVGQYFGALNTGDIRDLQTVWPGEVTDDLPPQAGLAVYERGSDGLLAAARSYDDIEAPFGRS